MEPPPAPPIQVTSSLTHPQVEGFLLWSFLDLTLGTWAPEGEARLGEKEVRPLLPGV